MISNSSLESSLLELLVSFKLPWPEESSWLRKWRFRDDGSRLRLWAGSLSEPLVGDSTMERILSIVFCSRRDFLLRSISQIDDPIDEHGEVDFGLIGFGLLDSGFEEIWTGFGIDCAIWWWRYWPDRYCWTACFICIIEISDWTCSENKF